MKSIATLILAAVTLLGGSVRAEFLEISASEITTIEPSDKSKAPRILVKWSLPTNLDKKIVDGAVMTMTVAVNGDAPLLLDVMPLTKTWSAGSAAWSSGWANEGGDFADSIPAPAIVTDKNAGKISADVYHVVREQIAGNEPNFGFILVPDEDSQTKTMAIAANDAARLTDARLVIAYRERR